MKSTGSLSKRKTVGGGQRAGGGAVSITVVLLFVSLFSGSYGEVNNDSLEILQLRVIGRHASLSEKPGEVSFDMPGVAIEADVAGTGPISFEMSQQGDVLSTFNIWCDGMEQPGKFNATFSTDGWKDGEVHRVVACEASQTKRTTVRIQKATEAKWNSLSVTPNFVTFHGFLDGSEGAHLALPAVGPMEPRRRRIEFFGDSITAGYCNLCTLASSGQTGPLLESYSHSWANIVCD
eukprot:g3061.t1